MDDITIIEGSVNVMDSQRKLRRDIGKDTHTRSVENNGFNSQSLNTVQVMTGEVLVTQPEPLYNKNMVTIQLSKGGFLTNVGYPGAVIDPLSGNLHGSYEGPIPGQMVTVGFINGNSAAPIVMNRYPYQGKGNTFTELKYSKPLTMKLYESTDVLMGHYSGSVIRLNTGLGVSGKLPGSISIESRTKTEIIALEAIELTASVNVKMTAPFIELNGNTNSFVLWSELSSILQQFATSLKASMISTPIAGSGATQPIWTPDPLAPIGTVDPVTGLPLINISTAKTTTVLTGG